MKKILPIIYTFLLMIFVFMLIYCLYLIGKGFLSLPSELSATIIAAVSTILVSVLSITVGKYYERKRLIENELREKKIPMYEEFIDFHFKILMGDKMKIKKMTDVEMMKFFNSFTQKLMVWGSDEVVNLWSTYRLSLVKKSSNEQTEQTEQTQNTGPMDTMFEFEKLLLAIRKDIGHKNKDINKGSLLGLFINDMDKYNK